eukprot:1981648-Alexandrium_andersonii.AAC.1
MLGPWSWVEHPRFLRASRRRPWVEPPQGHLGARAAEDLAETSAVATPALPAPEGGCSPATAPARA